ncbi:MAG: LytTR family DNA-binding domain-containing protein [Chryseolinea sp.]
MNTFRCLLVDDEPPALDILRTYIQSTPMLQVVGECHHAMAAFELLRQRQVDLIFLDINMPRLLGTEFLKTLTHPPRIVFTTAFREYAYDGFELGAVDYLLKPYSFERFLKAVHKVLELDQKSVDTQRDASNQVVEKFLYVRADRKMVKVMVHEILYIESLKDYVKIFLPNHQVITKQTISSLEDMLPEEEFMRIHRSFIVPLRRIDSYNQHAVFVNKAELPVGPLYKNELMKRLHQSGYSAA